MLSSNGELVYKQLSLSLSYDFPVYSKHTHVLVWLKKTHVWNFLVSFQQKEILKFFRGFTTEHSLTEHEINKYKDTYPLWTSLQITKRKKWYLTAVIRNATAVKNFVVVFQHIKVQFGIFLCILYWPSKKTVFLGVIIPFRFPKNEKKNATFL